MFYKLPLGALGTMEEPLAKWDMFHWVHTKCQLPPRKVGQGDEVNDSSWESLCCSRSGSEDQHSHPLSILRDEDTENIFLPGWCKPGTGLAVAWEALSILRKSHMLRDAFLDLNGQRHPRCLSFVLGCTDCHFICTMENVTSSS